MASLISTLEGLIGEWLTVFLLGFVALAVLITINAMFMVWFERKVAGWVQGRLGPMEHGPQGTLQTLLDVVKLLGKETIIPAKVDHATFILAPVVAFLPALVLLSLLPYSDALVFTNVESGILLVFAFGGVSLMGVFMGGWASNNKYALLGGVRAVSQNIAYELPLLLSAMAVVLSAGTLNIGGIVSAQTDDGFGWFFMYQPLALLIYIIAATAETNRAPFDIPEAESELVAGFHTEYPAMGFAVFFLAIGEVRLPMNSQRIKICFVRICIARQDYRHAIITNDLHIHHDHPATPIRRLSLKRRQTIRLLYNRNSHLAHKLLSII